MCQSYRNVISIWMKKCNIATTFIDIINIICDYSLDIIECEFSLKYKNDMSILNLSNNNKQVTLPVYDQLKIQWITLNETKHYINSSQTNKLICYRIKIIGTKPNWLFIGISNKLSNNYFKESNNDYLDNNICGYCFKSFNSFYSKYNSIKIIKIDKLNLKSNKYIQYRDMLIDFKKNIITYMDIYNIKDKINIKFNNKTKYCIPIFILHDKWSSNELSIKCYQINHRYFGKNTINGYSFKQQRRV